MRKTRKKETLVSGIVAALTLSLHAVWDLRVDLSNTCAGDARFGITLIPRGHVAQRF